MDLLRRLRSIFLGRSDVQTTPTTVNQAAGSSESILTIPPLSDEIGRSNLTKSILSAFLLPDLVSIVQEYATSVQYRLPKPSFESNAPIVVTGDRIICIGAERWQRIVVDWPIGRPDLNRWRIQIDFGPKETGRVAFGISCADIGWTQLTDWTWSSAATGDDYLVSMAAYLPVRAFHNGRVFEFGGCRTSTTNQSITAIDFQPAKRNMVVRFRDDWSEFRSMDAGITMPQVEFDAAVWRPCITVSGYVAVRVLPWPDDR